MYCPDTHSVFTAPPGAKVSDVQFGRHVDLCHSPSTSARSAQGRLSTDSTRGQTWVVFTSRSSSRASSIVPDLSLVRCFVPKSEEFVSEGIFSTVSLMLRTASWRHKCWISMCFALPSPVLLFVDGAALESMCSRIGDALYPSLWQTPEPHRLSGGAVPKLQFCFG